MKQRFIISISLLLAILTTGATALAEAPCTHIGQESLQAMAMCIRHARATGTLDSHHQDAMRVLAATPTVPPSAMSYGMPYMMPMLFVGGAMKGYPKGFNNTHTIYPYSWYMTFPGW